MWSEWKCQPLRAEWKSARTIASASVRQQLPIVHLQLFQILPPPSHVFLILIILYLTSQARLFLPDIKNQQEMLKRCFVWRRKKTELNYEFQVSASRSCSWKAVQFFPDISSSTTCVYNLCVLPVCTTCVYYISMQRRYSVGELYYRNLVTNADHQSKKSGQNQDGQHPGVDQMFNLWPI